MAAQIARQLGFIGSHAGSVNDLQIGNLCEILQDLFLNASTKASCPFVTTEIFERKNGQTFLRKNGAGILSAQSVPPARSISQRVSS